MLSFKFEELRFTFHASRATRGLGLLGACGVTILALGLKALFR